MAEIGHYEFPLRTDLTANGDLHDHIFGISYVLFYFKSAVRNTY